MYHNGDSDGTVTEGSFRGCCMRKKTNLNAYMVSNSPEVHVDYPTTLWSDHDQLGKAITG